MLAGFRGDQILLPLVAMLVAIGLVFIARLVGLDLAMRQVIWLAISCVALLVTMAVMRRSTILRRYKYTWALLGFGLVLVTFVFGQPSAPGGPRLWFNLGFFQFQPSEIWKIILVVFFAGYLDEYGDVLARGSWRIGPISLPPIPYMIPLLIMFGLSMAILFLQRDLGAALLVFSVFIAMLYVASGRILYLVAGFGIFAGAVFVSYRFIDIVRQRVEIWQDPFAQSTTFGYQIVQGLIAFANGGFFGQGLGMGAPGWVPAVHTDYMLAAIAEEMGFLGAVAVVLIYLLLSYRAYRIGIHANSRFNQLLGVGLATVISVQAIVIMAGVLKLIPLTGITLPFVSYGGSSLLTNFVILGILLYLSQRTAGKSLL
jgi:cell division protein FtsW (lipid II flippase)